LIGIGCMTLTAKSALQSARVAKEACELIETGFEYVTGEYTDGGKIFRKRNSQNNPFTRETWVYKSLFASISFNRYAENAQ
jgi:hypothetical protein